MDDSKTKIWSSINLQKIPFHNKSKQQILLEKQPKTKSLEFRMKSEGFWGLLMVTYGGP